LSSYFSKGDYKGLDRQST